MHSWFLLVVDVQNKTEYSPSVKRGKYNVRPQHPYFWVWKIHSSSLNMLPRVITAAIPHTQEIKDCPSINPTAAHSSSAEPIPNSPQFTVLRLGNGTSYDNASHSTFRSWWNVEHRCSQWTRKRRPR